MISKEKSVGINLLFCDKEEEINYENIADIDILYIKEKPKNTDNFFYVPYKVTYKFNVPKTEEDYFNSLSKNKKKKIKKSLKKAKEENIEFVFQFPLQKKHFFEWIEVYRDNINLKEKKEFHVDETWFDTHNERKGGMFAIKEGKIIGGIVFKKMLENEYFKERWSIGFSSTKKVFTILGINELLNYYLINQAIKNNIKLILRGMDINIYGNHLSTGLYLFKKSLGFKTIPYPKKGFYYMKINSFKKFKNELLFFSIKEEESLIANMMSRKEIEKPDDFKAGFLVGLKFYKIINDNSFQEIKELS
jgi:desulfoferrodoxin (superoxide reductase-like protein)